MDAPAAAALGVALIRHGTRPIRQARDHHLRTTLRAAATQRRRDLATCDDPFGINDELHPWLHMTTPADLRRRTIEQVPVGRRLGRSWLLALRALPVDSDDFSLTDTGPPPGLPRGGLR
jgi:hypothetical protein